MSLLITYVLGPPTVQAYETLNPKPYEPNWGLYRKPYTTVNSIKLETGLRPNSAGIPHTLLLRIEAKGFPTFGLLLYTKP